MTTNQQQRAPRIVAGVDGSPSSAVALRWALRQARLTGATVDAVIAWHQLSAAGVYGWTAPVAVVDDFDFEGLAKKVLDQAIGDAGPAGDVTVNRLVVEGKPAQVLLATAAGADLLVVGSRGHGAFTEALLGSTSHHCVHHAPCPVVIVRGEGQ